MREPRWIEWLPYILLVGAVWAIFAVNLSGCAAPAQCVKPVIHLERPVLPTIRATELKCLSDEAYRKIVERDLTLKEAFAECELIVDGLTE